MSITPGNWELFYDALDPDGDGWEPVGIHVDSRDEDGNRHVTTVLTNDLDAFGPFIDETQPDGRVARANAQLMVSSPKLLEACELAVAARACQRTYFKNKSQANLIASKIAEKKADDALAAAIKKASDIEGQEGYAQHQPVYQQAAVVLP